MAVVAVGLVGAVLVGGGVTAELLAHHPRFASRLRAALLPAATSAPIQVGNVGDVTVTVDVLADGQPISPFIYGVASADKDTLIALGATVDRWGGNPSTRFNWANGHAWNAARDYEFRNTNYGNPQGSVADGFVADAIAAGAVPLMTIPSIGWVARNDNSSVQ